PGVIVLGDKSVTGAGIFVTKGSQLMAIGTETAPIVFTSNQAPGARAKGDWGGIVLMGKASNNLPNGINNIEGLAVSSDTEFGGGTSPDDNDNSGTLKYVRIEFGGYVYQPNKEINALTFGSVGKGTIIDYIQASFCNDDSYEWFGGTVNCKHLVSYRCLDDDFDTDNGFSGKIQFGLAVRDPQIADVPAVSTSEFFESDNDATGTMNTPITNPIFSNITCIGPLRGSLTNTVDVGHKSRARIRRSSTTSIYNSILTDQASSALYVDGANCETAANGGTLKFMNNIVAGYKTVAIETGTFGILTNKTTWLKVTQLNDTLTSTTNLMTTPYNYTSPDYRPTANSIALSGASFSDSKISPFVSSYTSTVSVSTPTGACIGQPNALQDFTFTATNTIAPEFCSMSWSVSPGVAISSTTAMNPTFTVNTIGTFTVYLMVTDANGMQTAMSAVTTQTCLDVAVKEAKSEIGSVVLYPNPAKEAVTIRVNTQNAGNISANIYDITGKLVLSPVQNQNLLNGENNFSFNTSELQNGVYFVTLSNAKGKETVKLIVNK
ncbi:MAG: T9SS type A sorting domain-containing protein, partial [Bacteroidia bacterium]|nr:T9SS type A sorting domain-containing protein [Bacteroidia bacterium]